MKHPRWRQLQRHPLSAEWPDLSAAAMREMVAEMEIEGFDKRFPIVLYEGKVLDGWQRITACRAAGVIPDFVRLPANREARAFVWMANKNRRHAKPEFLESMAEERRKRVQAAREAEESIRTIAENEGVSPAQIHRDVRKIESGVSGETPDAKKQETTGKDGKKYVRKSNAGAVKFSLKEFKGHLGRAQHEIDKMARHYGVPPVKGYATNRQHREINEMFDRLDRDCVEWQKALGNLK